MVGCLAAVLECLPTSEMTLSQSLYKPGKLFPVSAFRVKGFSSYQWRLEQKRDWCPLQRLQRGLWVPEGQVPTAADGMGRCRHV